VYVDYSLKVAVLRLHTLCLTNLISPLHTASRCYSIPLDTKSLHRDDRSRYSSLMKKCTSQWFCQNQMVQQAVAWALGWYLQAFLCYSMLCKLIAYINRWSGRLLFCASMLLSRVYRFQNWLEATQKVARGDWAPKVSITDRGRSLNKVRGRMS